MVRINIINRIIFPYLILQMISCSSRLEMTTLQTSEDIIHEKVEIQTLHGKKYLLLSYKITDSEIIGKDENGILYSENLNNIKHIIKIRPPSTGNIITLTLLASALIGAIYIYSQAAGLSDLR